jgi:nitroreductase
MNIKKAATDNPILSELARRWSPYGFEDRMVSESDLRSLFEAARWAASSYNEQPWNYIVATKADPHEFAKLLSCLAEANQAWANAAPVLVLCIVSLRFVKNETENRAAVHDLGLADGNLLVEATNRGLSVHQMRIPARLSVSPIPMAVSIPSSLCRWQSGRPFCDDGRVGKTNH